ncbi:hypothetical protein NE237_008925 [Protea cynaroides]|uniref:4-hydroxyphenylpyruvate dioxygenase n=1 Tax=Protea cynaroides TaxID=273540 RepID=A0A9Q0QZT0_9MAGN|nr:hypothetical protein NE237_008925 [Protea cynaroides]
MVEKGIFKLVGFSNFVCQNPKSNCFHLKRFHHIEFWCTDAINRPNRFSWGLGMPIVAKSDLFIGNQVHASYLLHSGDFNLLFTVPYSPSIFTTYNFTHTAVIPTLSHSAVSSFDDTHGLAFRAIAIEVEDTITAFNASVTNGAKPLSPPVDLDGSTVVITKIQINSDVVFRYSCS